MAKIAFEKLDVFRLFQDWDDNRYSLFLQKKIKTSDMQALMKARYGLQVGMSDLADKEICHDEHVNKFIRWQKMTEHAIKILFRRKNPNPLDNPANKNNPKLDMNACRKHKKERDRELELLLRKYSY